MRKWFAGMGEKEMSKFGSFLRKKGISQQEVVDASGVSRATVQRICSDPDYEPYRETLLKIKKGMKELGVEISLRQFWG